ncbi:MAG: diacylglycerol kinase family protein [Anaerolineae bacterium]
MRRRESLAGSFRCAGRGVLGALVAQRSLRIQVGIGLLAVALGLLLGLSLTEWAVITLSVALVLAAEVFNTAIEAAVDLACPDHNELARLAKDAGAGATLIAAIASVVVGMAVFLPKLFGMLGLR